jgi:putative phage-type endonuclease
MRSQLMSQRPALKLVKTNHLSRDEWLAVRKGGIGSSDAGTAVGLNPYQSQLELWMIKTGRDAALPQVDPNDEDSPMYWGTLLEPIVARITRRTVTGYARSMRYYSIPTRTRAGCWRISTGKSWGQWTCRFWNVKTAGEFGARLWRDGVPDYVVCQVQHQLAVTGKAAADVCVLVCGQEIIFIG